MAATAMDWSRHVVDHLEVHASDYEASVRFYATVLEPLGIPHWPEDEEGERITCFTRVSVVDRRPPTTEMHLCFVAESREQVELFIARASRRDSARTESPATVATAPATTRRSCSTRTGTTSRRSTATSGIPDTRRRRSTRARTYFVALSHKVTFELSPPP